MTTKPKVFVSVSGAASNQAKSFMIAQARDYLDKHRDSVKITQWDEAKGSLSNQLKGCDLILMVPPARNSSHNKVINLGKGQSNEHIIANYEGIPIVYLLPSTTGFDVYDVRDSEIDITGFDMTDWSDNHSTIKNTSDTRYRSINAAIDKHIGSSKRTVVEDDKPLDTVEHSPLPKVGEEELLLITYYL